MSVSGVEIRGYCSADDAALHRLHTRSFDPPWTQERWDWRFHRDVHTGVGLVGAFAGDGSCVALHGGRAHRILIDGREALGMSHSDVALDPDVRSGIGGSRYVVRVGRQFIETLCRKSCGIIWGFPQPALRRLLARFVKVEVLCDVVFLIHELRNEIPSTSAVRVSEVDRWSDDVDDLWNRCKRDFAGGVVRDRRYLNWRFATHPMIDYSLVEARDERTDSLRGICVIRRGGWSDDLISIMEWLVPLDDRDAEQALLVWSVSKARAEGAEYVVSWFSTNSLQFHRLQSDHGFIAHPTPYQQMFVSWTPGVDREWLHQNWYQTMGDIDFF